MQNTRKDAWNLQWLTILPSNTSWGIELFDPKLDNAFTTRQRNHKELQEQFYLKATIKSIFSLNTDTIGGKNTVRFMK